MNEENLYSGTPSPLRIIHMNLIITFGYSKIINYTKKYISNYNKLGRNRKRITYKQYYSLLFL